jgi:gas vesicle protein
VQRLPLIALVFVTAALGLMAAGCGSKSPPSSAEWVDGVCSSIVTWKDSLASSAQSLQGGNLSQDSLRNAADEMKSATDTLESDIKDLGKPESDTGQQAKDSVDQLSSELSDGADSIKSTVDDVSDVSGVVSATASVTATLGTMANQISSTVKSLQQLDPGGELQTAFNQSSSCQELKTAASS